MRVTDLYSGSLRLISIIASLALLLPVAVAQSAICGDGAVDLRHEQCDDGNTIPGDGCDAFCFDEYDCGQVALNRTGNTWTLHPLSSLDDTLSIQCAFDAAAAEYAVSGASDIVIRLDGGKFYTNEILASGFNGTLEGNGLGATVLDTVRGGAPGARAIMRTRVHPEPAVLVFEDGDFTVRGITFDITPYSPTDIPSRYAADLGIQTVIPSALLVTGVAPNSHVENCEFIAHQGEGVTFHEFELDYGGNMVTALSYQGYAQYPDAVYPAEWPTRSFSEPMGGIHVVSNSHFQNVFFATEPIYLQNAFVAVTDNTVDWGNLSSFFDNDGVDMVISQNIVTNGSWATVQGGTFGPVWDDPPYTGRWPTNSPIIDINNNDIHYVTRAFGLPEGQVAAPGEGIAVGDYGALFGAGAPITLSVSDNRIVMAPVNNHETNDAIWLFGITEGTISNNDIEVTGSAYEGMYLRWTDHMQVVGNTIKLSGATVWSGIDDTYGLANSIIDTRIEVATGSEIVYGGISTWFTDGEIVDDARFLGLSSSGPGLYIYRSVLGEYTDLNFRRSGLPGWSNGLGAMYFLNAPENTICDVSFPKGTDASDQVMYDVYEPAYCE